MMPENMDVPIGLLRRLAAGDLSDDELDLLQVWLNSEGLTRPPAHVLRQAQRIPAAQRPSLWRRLVASLVQDSGFQPVMAGARGGSSARYLNYVADELDLELELTPAGSGAETLVGQITGGESWSTAELVTAEGSRLETSIDPAGMFAFPPAVQPRTVTMRGEAMEVHLDLPVEDAGA